MKQFRSQDGSCVNQAQHIRLYLSDFGPDELSANIPERQLEISYAKLAHFLTRAEKMRRTRESSSGIKSERKTRKRKLSSSSAEVMRSEDETMHRRWEKEDAERSAARDADFNPPSRRRRL